MAQAAYQHTETIPLDQLQQFPGNARRGDVDTILNSLRRNGQYRSLVVRQIPDGPLIVLAGNHTMQALALHGRGPCDVPAKARNGKQPCGICHGQPWEPVARVEIVTCDDDTARRINLVDNRSSEIGEYDRDALTELLSCVNEDYGGTGYTDADVQLLTAPAPSLEELADTYGDPADDDFWPVLKFKVSPDDRDTFYSLTKNSPNPDDDSARFRYLLARSTEEPV